MEWVRLGTGSMITSCSVRSDGVGRGWKFGLEAGGVFGHVGDWRVELNVDC